MRDLKGVGGQSVGKAEGGVRGAVLRCHGGTAQARKARVPWRVPSSRQLEHQPEL